MVHVPELLSEELSHVSHMFNVLVRKYKDGPTKQEYNRTIVDIGHRAAVVVLPLLFMNGETHVVFTKQYRHAVDKVCLELPAGVIDEGEGMWDAAHRELEEETGFASRSMQYLCTVEVSPGWNNERQHFFVAWELEPSGSLEQDPFENIETEIVPIIGVAELIRSGKLTDSKSIACVGLRFINHDASRRG